MATFGGLDGAGTNVQTFSGDRSYVDQATPASSGVVTNGRGRVRLTATGSTLAKVVIYSDSGGEPDVLLAVSDEVTVNWTTSAETNFPFSGANQISIVGGTPYWRGFIFDDPGTPSFEMRRNNTAGLVRYAAVTYPTPDDPFSSDGSSNGPLNIMIDYTEASSQIKKFVGITLANIKKAIGITEANIKELAGVINS